MFLPVFHMLRPPVSMMSSFGDASARSSRSGANLAKYARKHRRSSNAPQESHISPAVFLTKRVIVLAKGLIVNIIVAVQSVPVLGHLDR